jgi:hypothetical protein
MLEHKDRDNNQPMDSMKTTLDLFSEPVELIRINLKKLLKYNKLEETLGARIA